LFKGDTSTGSKTFIAYNCRQFLFVFKPEFGDAALKMILDIMLQPVTCNNSQLISVDQSFIIFFNFMDTTRKSFNYLQTCPGVVTDIENIIKTIAIVKKRLVHYQ